MPAPPGPPAEPARSYRHLRRPATAVILRVEAPPNLRSHSQGCRAPLRAAPPPPECARAVRHAAPTAGLLTLGKALTEAARLATRQER